MLFQILKSITFCNFTLSMDGSRIKPYLDKYIVQYLYNIYIKYLMSKIKNNHRKLNCFIDIII